MLLVFIAAFAIRSYNSGERPSDPGGSAGISDNQNNKDNTDNSSVQNQDASTANQSKDFTLTDLEGKSVKLSDLKGKKVLLNFWATWCPPCQAEMPDMEKFYAETKDTDLVILAVNIGEDRETAKSFMEKSGYSFRVLLDTGSEVAALYNIRAIPTSYFINSDGNISNQHIGAMDLLQMKQYLSEMNQ